MSRALARLRSRRRLPGAVSGGVAVLAALAVGAAHPAPPVAAEPGGEAGRAVSPGPEELVSNDGTYFLTYTREETPVPESEPFSVEVAVFLDAARERPAAQVALAFDARMPQHGHGMRREPRVERLGPGRFRVGGILLHMPGYWELYFDVTRGAITERAQTSLMVD